MRCLQDEALLDSALAAPFQEFGGKVLFPSIEEKADRLGYGLIKNHAMIDGNKRIGTHVMLVFLVKYILYLTFILLSKIPRFFCNNSRF